MGDRLSAAFNRAKASIESLYRDKATIYVKADITTQTGFDDRSELRAILTDIPAKISRSGLKAAEKGQFAGVQYDATLYLDTTTQIPAGAVIDVTDTNGQTTRYRRASLGYQSYLTHQEVALTFDERK